MKNKVSVITTVRNEEDNIRFLIDSILKQNYSFHEFIINDNNSIDNTVAVIEEYSLLDNRIKVVKSGDLSIGEGRNAAIKYSSGDILAIIDSGIAPSKEWLGRVVTPLIEDEKIDVSWGHVIFDTKSRIVESSDIALALVFLTKYPEERKDATNVTSSAFRRRVWDELGGFPEIDLPIEDLLLVDKIKKMKSKSVHVPEAKVYYFRFPETISDVYKKWSYAAYSAFAVKKSERGFGRQIVIFGLFFLSVFLTFIDLRAFILVGVYIFLYFANKVYLNQPVAKKVFSNIFLFGVTLNLFFVLNVARAIGVGKAVFDTILGKVPQEHSL